MYDFRFIYFLTLIHSLFTLSGMMAFSAFGLYKRKAVPVMQVGPHTDTQGLMSVVRRVRTPPSAGTNACHGSSKAALILSGKRTGLGCSYLQPC